MNTKRWLSKVYTEKRVVKLTKCLAALFVMVLSIFVLAGRVPETKMITSTVESIEKSNETIRNFSGATIATSLAITALPDDFATPLAETLVDMNTYFIFIFAVLFVEKLIVVEGVKLAFIYIIPAACALYIAYVLVGKDQLKAFAVKLVILGLAVVFVIPFSTHFAEKVCADYLVYVDETIDETTSGAEKVNEIMVSGEEESIFDKLSEAFKTAIQGITDLLTYFENVIKKCVNAIAIMIVTTFVVPMLILLLFRWLLNGLFGWNIPRPQISIRPPKWKKEDGEEVLKIEDKGDEV